MAWLYLVLAGAFEVVGVTGMNKVVKDKNLQSYIVLFMGFIISFGFLSLAMKTLLWESPIRYGQGLELWEE